MKKTLVFLMILPLFLSGCATLFSGNTRKVSLNQYADSEVYIDGELKGKTPLKIKLENNKSYKVEFKKDGKILSSGNIFRSVSAGYIILDILAGLIPVIIDAATGSWYYLEYSGVENK